MLPPATRRITTDESANSNAPSAQYLLVLLAKNAVSLRFSKNQTM
jgi:hypothetical protein